MKLIIKINLILLIVCTLSCKKDDTEKVTSTNTGNGTLELMFQNSMSNLEGNSIDLLTEDTVYKTSNGDTLSFSTFKYYISNIKLISQEGDTIEVEDSYHLVKSTEMMAMTTFNLTIPKGQYEFIIFSLGVDSTANMDETIIKGDLNPSSNMVWNWSIGYKFLLIEGGYNHNSSNGKFLYHIGLNSNYTTYTKDLPMTLKVEKEKTSSMHIMANFDKFFGGNHTIDIETVNTVKVGPKEQVSMLIENYQNNLFMVDHIENAE